MADRYWVGGTGTWDATTTTNWSATSGGAGGASAPTSVDNAIFDSLSNATAYTVTVGTNVVCNDLTAAGPLTGNVTFSLGATARLDPYGSMTLPATGLTWTSSGGSVVTFRSTTTGKTVTTNGVSFSNTDINFNGVGGGWTLGSAFSSASLLVLLSGTLDSANFNITCGIFRSNTASNRTLTLGSSTFTTTNASSGGWENINSGSTFTLNAGTSQIISNGAFTWLESSDFSGKTFYNVRFTRTSGMTVGNANTYNEIDFSAPASGATFTLAGSNTITNLKIASLAATGAAAIALSADQTVNGTLTLGAANTAIRRIQVQSSVIGTQRTITLNGTLATLADVDFRNIATAGSAGTWTGTRLGNGLGNSGITFTAAKDVYWNLAAGGTWVATAWALSSGGAVDANNFPLAQDKVVIEDTGLNSGATVQFVSASYWIGELDISTRTLPMTFASANLIGFIYKNLTLSSVVTMTGTTAWQFVGQGTTQILDTNTAIFTPPFAINSATGTLQLAENTTCSATVTLTGGTLSLNNNTLTCLAFASTNTNTRVIAFGTGNITTTGSGTVWTTATPTNFSYTGTPTVNISNNSATSTTINTGLLTELQALNFNYTIGTYTLIDSTNCVYRSVNFTGFAGTIAGTARAVFGNYTLSTGMTLTAGTGVTTFAATSGTQLITTNGKTIDNPITQSGVGGTVQLQDNLTMGSTRTFTLTNGSFNVNGKVFTTGIFSSSNSNIRTLNLGVNGRLAINGGNYTATTTGLSFSGTGTISMDLATAKTFAGGGGVYPFTLNQGGAGTLTITGANTFANITNTNPTASQITFPASTITSVRALSLAGSSGNLVSMRSSTLGTPYTIKLV